MQIAERDASRCKIAMLDATEKLCSQQAELDSSLHQVPPLLLVSALPFSPTKKERTDCGQADDEV